MQSRHVSAGVLQRMSRFCNQQHLLQCAASTVAAEEPGASRPSAENTASTSSGTGGMNTDGRVRRVYNKVGIAEASGQEGFHILLDKKHLRTPALKPMLLPTRALAIAIAAEWEYQDSRTVRPFTMPLTQIAATALDQPRSRDQVIDLLLQYVHTDGACCREPGKLAQLQAKVFDPIIEWAEEEFQASLNVTDSLVGLHQPLEFLVMLRQWLEGLNKWELTVVDLLAASAKSVLLAAAIIKGRIGISAALSAARLEETLQIAHWGLVEGGHDIDIADIRVRVAAPALFLRLLNER